jgi:hypothetical protein
VVAERRLAPHASELLAWVYGEFVTQVHARGAAAVAVFLPKPESIPGDPEVIAAQMELAERAGFAVLDVGGAYAGTEDLEELWVARWDRHPNRRGHQLLADALHRVLSDQLAEGADPHQKGP